MRLLFQPAEEGGAGASHMIKEGALGDAEAIFGMHVDYEGPTGSISTLAGPVLAAVCFFEAKIVGKGGHAAEPHNSIDPILAASFAILALQQLISRESDPLNSQVCYRCTILHLILYLEEHIINRKTHRRKFCSFHDINSKSGFSSTNFHVFYLILDIGVSCL